jgi:aspartate kinase
MIVAESESPDQAVSGCALAKDEARITMRGVPDKPGTSFEIFSRLAAKSISVDMIVQNVAEEGLADISFTVPKNELRSCMDALREAAAVTGVVEITHDDQVAKVSVVGLGMAKQTGVADKTFRALAEAGVNIQMITTSEIKISVLVARDEGQKALRAVHQAFELHKPPVDRNGRGAVDSGPHGGTPEDVVARLQSLNMEELTIDDITLDQAQARVTIRGVPDRPGIAARVFEEVAKAGIFVDMIVQNFDIQDGRVNLTFTVPASGLKGAIGVADRLSNELGCKAVTSNPLIAKLSVSGIGLRSHTGVAIRAFRALAEAGINVEMINTSEVLVNLVVAGPDGAKGLTALQAAFADVTR